MILITGYKGFIGSNLIKRFKPEDLILVGYEDCFSSLFLTDWSKVTKIYHLGGISDTTCSDLNLLHEYNVNFTMELFNRAKIHNIPIVYASSASVYGNSLTYTPNPLNHYAISKANVDIWVESNYKDFKNIIGVRFFNVYGDGEDHKGNQASPIHQFTLQAKQNKNIKVFEGSDNFIRDFIWVEDAIDCIIEDKHSGIYDVGTSKPVSFRFIADLIAKKYNCSVEEIKFPEKLRHKYQFYTCARKHYNKQFMDVREYLK
jgi:ADP-L-glycero-D-manno-heptose 6-epimerase